MLCLMNGKMEFTLPDTISDSFDYLGMNDPLIDLDVTPNVVILSLRGAVYDLAAVLIKKLTLMKSDIMSKQNPTDIMTMRMKILPF